jgi:hypothetical protein
MEIVILDQTEVRPLQSQESMPVHNEEDCPDDTPTVLTEQETSAELEALDSIKESCRRKASSKGFPKKPSLRNVIEANTEELRAIKHFMQQTVETFEIEKAKRRAVVRAMKQRLEPRPRYRRSIRHVDSIIINSGDTMTVKVYGRTGWKFRGILFNHLPSHILLINATIGYYRADAPWCHSSVFPVPLIHIQHWNDMISENPVEINGDLLLNLRSRHRQDPPTELIMSALWDELVPHEEP